MKFIEVIFFLKSLAFIHHHKSLFTIPVASLSFSVFTIPILTHVHYHFSRLIPRLSHPLPEIYSILLNRLIGTFGEICCSGLDPLAQQFHTEHLYCPIGV
jgi:hypothetical protein